MLREGAQVKYHGLCERLWANCRVSTRDSYKGTPCWDWTGKVIKDKSGKLAYGVYTIRVKGQRCPKNRRAHRASLRIFGGVKFKGYHEANHLCCRTICINPLHLIRVTRTQNEGYKRFLTKQRHARHVVAPDAFDIGQRVETTGEEIPF
jgi:hypothetical protein